jgi:hypothetical protein
MHGNNTRKLTPCVSQISKNTMFLFLFYVFSSTKSVNRRVEQVLQRMVALLGGERVGG